MNKIVSAFTAFLFLSILGMVSCQKAIVDNLDNVVVNKQHLVSLQVNEEAINIISESPLFKSAKSLTRTDESKKVYAINIYCKDGITTKNYSKYAYGLFDDPSQIKLLITEGKIYKFECLVVEDNEDKIYSSNGEYLMPFKHGALADEADCFPTKLENKFVLSSTENLPFIIYGRTNISKDDVAEAPRMIKQYGVLENYSAEANSSISINTKLMVYGLHFVITPPEEGTLELTYLPMKTITVKSTDPKYDHASIYAFNRISSVYNGNEKADITLSLIWTLNNGTKKSYTKQITIERNVMTKLGIAVQLPTPNKFSIVEENEKMKEKDFGIWTPQNQ